MTNAMNEDLDPVVRIGDEVHVFWPPDDPEAENLITIRELIEFAHRSNEAFARFLRMKRLH